LSSTSEAKDWKNVTKVLQSGILALRNKAKATTYSAHSPADWMLRAPEIADHACIVCV